MITAAPQNDLSLNYYRALFDYDPTTMSPNPNHHDEIKFKEEDDRDESMMNDVSTVCEDDRDVYFLNVSISRGGISEQNVKYAFT